MNYRYISISTLSCLCIFVIKKNISYEKFLNKLLFISHLKASFKAFLQMNKVNRQREIPKPMYFKV